MAEVKFVDATYKPYEPTNWLTFDDVSIIPQYSDIPSRNDSSISLTTHFTPRVKISAPIVSSPMSCVTEGAMAVLMANCGGAGILHRFYEAAHGEEGWSKFESDVKRLIDLNIVPAISVGAAKEDVEIVRKVLGWCNTHVIVCVDVANGHTLVAQQAVRRLRDVFKDKVEIVAGNVASPLGVMQLAKAGADAIRVGIGGGSQCSTRIVTGHGTPQLTTIMQARKAINSLATNVTLIADGGIRNSGDILKAIAAGADCVMVGGLLTPSSESPVHKLSYDEYKGHRVYGESSSILNSAINKKAVAEGEIVYKASRGSTFEIVDSLIKGIKSGMTYSGARNLDDFSRRVNFVEVSRAGYIEGTAHGTN